LKKFENQIDALTLIPSSGGRFEVLVNGKLIFSKAESHRHAFPGEIAAMISIILTESKPS